MLRVIEYFAKSLNVIRNGTIQQIACEFLSAFHSNAGPILYHFRDNARYWSKFGFRPPTFDTTVRESPSKYCDNVCCRKTRMVRLPSGEKKVWECVYWFRHNTRTWQTPDGRTDTARQHRARLCIASRGKNLHVVEALPDCHWWACILTAPSNNPVPSGK